MATLYTIQPRDRTTHSAGQPDFPGLPIQPQLRDVNRCLQFLELPPLSASAMQALLSQQPRDRVLRAHPAGRPWRCRLARVPAPPDYGDLSIASGAAATNSTIVHRGCRAHSPCGTRWNRCRCRQSVGDAGD